MQNRTKTEKIKTAVWLVLGLAMLVYYIISGIFAGFRISMLGIWALGGVVCLVAAALTAVRASAPARLAVPRRLCAPCLCRGALACDRGRRGLHDGGKG